MIDPVQEATKIFNRKMSLPQYAGYKNSQTAQGNLFEDCLREALAAQESEANYARNIIQRQAGR